MRFCNKHCEKEAHTKEKPTKTEPENFSDRENCLKKEIEAEMKCQEKRERRNIRIVKLFTNSAINFNNLTKEDLKAFENLTK